MVYGKTNYKDTIFISPIYLKSKENLPIFISGLNCYNQKKRLKEIMIFPNQKKINLALQKQHKSEDDFH
jgi:hypothetical protein